MARSHIRPLPAGANVTRDILPARSDYLGQGHQWFNVPEPQQEELRHCALSGHITELE